MYRVQSNANRATNQMQGAAGTLSAMTKKREVKTEKPEMGIGEMAMQGVGMTMLGLEISENDFVKGLFEGSPESVGQDPAIKEGLFEVKDELEIGRAHV